MDSRSMLWLLEHSIRKTLEEFSEGTPVIPEPKHLLHSLFLKDIDSADLLREANEEEYGVRIVYFFVRNISVAQNIGITFAISGETPLETALHHLDEAQTCKFGKNEHENDELQNELAKIKTETLIQAVLVAARTRDTRYARGIFTRHSNFLTKSQRESIQCVLLGMEDFEKDFISYEQYLKKVQHLTTHMLKMTKPVIMRQVSQSFLDRVGRGGKAFREMAEILDSDNDDTISKLGGVDSEKKLRHRQRSDIEADDVVRNSRDKTKIPSANKITHKLSNGVGHERDQILHSDMINSDGSDCDSPIIFKSHQIGSLNEQMMEGDSKVPESGQSNAPASADMPGPSNRSEMPDDFAAPKLPTIRPRPQNRRRTISRASFAADPSPPRRGSSQIKAFSVIGAGGSKPTHRRDVLPTPPASFAVRSNAGWSSATGVASHRKHPFNPLQDSYIIMGVEKYGFGHWAKIRKEYAFPEYRTSVHLKDRWRTLLSQKAITVRADGEIILSEQYETTIKYLKENHTLTAEGATLPTFELKKTRTERRATKVRESESSGIESPYYRSPAVSGDSDDNRPNMRGFDAVEKWRRSERGNGHPVKRKIPPLLLKNKHKSKHPESRGDEGPKENHIHPRLLPPAYGNSRNDKSPPSTTKPRNLSGGDNIQSTSRGPPTSNATLLHALLPQPDQTEKRSDVSHSTGVNPTNRNSPSHTPTGAGNVSGSDNIRSTSKGPPTNVPQNKRFVNLGPASFEKNDNPALMEIPENSKVPKNHNNSSTASMENPEILSPALMGNRVNPLLMKSDKNSSPASIENHENSSPSLIEKRNNSSPVLMRNQNISKPVLTENDKISETEEVVIIEDDSSDADPPSSSLDHAGNEMIQGSNAAAVDNTLTGVFTGAVMNQNDNVTQESVRKHVNQGVSDAELENSQQTHAGYEMIRNSDERGSGIGQPNSDVRLMQENICQGVDPETTIGLLTGHASADTTVPESSSDCSEDSFIVVDDVESYSYSIASEISSVASDSLIQRQASPILGATSGWSITRGCGVPNDGDTPSTDDRRVTTDGEETGKAQTIQAERGPASDGRTIGDNGEASGSAQGDGAGDRSPKKNRDTSGLASKNLVPVEDIYPSSPSIYFSADEGWLGSPENQQNDTLLGPDESLADRVDTTASGPLEPGANDGDRSQAELENTITGDTESAGEESSSERVLDAEIPDNLEQFLQDNPVSAPSSSSASQPISQSGENDGRISNGNTQSSSATTSSAPHQASSQELFESGKNKDDSVGNTNCQTDGTGIMVPEKNLRTSPPSLSQQSKTRIKKRKKTKGNTTTNVPYRHQPSGGGEVDETETNTHCNAPSAPQNSKSSKKPTKTADGDRERAENNSGTSTSDGAMNSSAEILAVANLDSSSGQGPNQTF